jgi:hypothetical protein
MRYLVTLKYDDSSIKSAFALGAALQDEECLDPKYGVIVSVEPVMEGWTKDIK